MRVKKLKHDVEDRRIQTIGPSRVTTVFQLRCIHKSRREEAISSMSAFHIQSRPRHGAAPPSHRSKPKLMYYQRGDSIVSQRIKILDSCYKLMSAPSRASERPRKVNLHRSVTSLRFESVAMVNRASNDCRRQLPIG